MKQMFDISEELVSEQSNEIYGVKTIGWKNSSWKYLSLNGDEQVISLQRTKRSTYSQILFCALVKYTRTHNQIMHGKTDWRGSKVHRNAETWTKLMGSQWNSSGMGETPENFTGRIIFMSMFNDISRGIERQQERMRIKCSTRFSLCKKIRNRTTVIPRTWDQRKSGILSVKIV